MSIEFRLMEVSDIPASIELWKSMKGLAIRGSDNIRDLTDHVNMNPKHNFVASSDGQLIGTVLGGFDGRRGYIYHLAVHESFRRKNIAKELMDKCFQSFKEINVSKCHMMVLKDNTEAQEFYKQIGCELRTELLVFSKTL
ncbi:MAG: GNAT family N-acetyltransferase [Bacteroidetes bacterium]|nr:GNAT family N-acetyltransferase [Bacteroidota bacterium]